MWLKQGLGDYNYKIYKFNKTYENKVTFHTMNVIHLVDEERKI